jgi:signal transduction histidine kinase
LPLPEAGPGGFGDDGPVIALREPAPGLAPAHDRFAGGPPWSVIALDLGIRALLIALAAWLGSRWLAKPVARLVRASHRLGDALAQGKTLPQIDERRGTREVREAAQVFNRMARELKHQFDARGLMVSAISHDLRTPLTRMRMRLETGDAAPALRERCVADIREMDGLIDSVLELFRSQHADTPLQRTDVAALVQSMVDDLAEQGAAVTGDFALAGHAVVPADPLALRRVLGNLIGNGLRYGQRVRVAVHGDTDALRLTVDDDGPGIPPDQLEAVFEPFVRVEASRNRGSGGVGLGLFIARELMRRQGGELQIANRAEGGLRAELRLSRRGA